MRSKSFATACTMLGLFGCQGVLGIQDRAPGDVDGGASDNGKNSDAALDDGGAGPTSDAGPSDAGDAGVRAIETLGDFQDPLFAQDDAWVYVADRTDRSTLVRIAKDGSGKTDKLADDLASASTSIQSMGTAQGLLFFTTTDGYLHSMRPDGANPTVVRTAPSEIVASSAKTLWLADPDSLASQLTLRWYGEPSQLATSPDAQANLDGFVGFAEATNDELVYGTRTANGGWKAGRFRPFSETPMQDLAQVTYYMTSMTADAERVILFGEDEGTVVAFSRANPGAPPVTLIASLSDVTTPLMMKSDGKHLYLRSQRWVKSCDLAHCADTLATVADGFVHARILQLDDRWIYVSTGTTPDSALTLKRIPR